MPHGHSESRTAESPGGDATDKLIEPMADHCGHRRGKWSHLTVQLANAGGLRSQLWRRRESNPRPRSYRTNVYERSPRLDLTRRPGADALPAGQPILWVSSLRRLALRRLLARSLAPRTPASGRTGMGRRLT